MLHRRSIRVIIVACLLCAQGCTSLRELPRRDFAARPERKAVRAETRDRLVYEFDYATFDPDSMTGYRHRNDVEGPVDQIAVVRVALEDIDHLSTRSLDWYRTGLVGGGVLAAVLAAGLAKSNAGSDGGSGGGGGGGPRIP